MKTERERQEMINNINGILQHAYDSTLDEIYALLKRIEAEEDEKDLKAYYSTKSDKENDITIAWEEIKKEIANERKKDVA